MVVDEYSLLHGLGLELPVQIDNSVGQDFLLLEKKNYPAAVNVIYEHEESQQNSSEEEEVEWSKALVCMPTFTIKEIGKHRQLSGKI